MALIATILAGLVFLVGFALVLAFYGDGLKDDPVDHGDLGLPDRPLTADDIPALRFRTGFRGYRMEDVDAALDQITASLRGGQPKDR